MRLCFFFVFAMSAVGTADADAPPPSAKVKPAAPNAGTAALVTRFFFEACFTRDIVASSIRGNKSFESRATRLYAWQICRARLLAYTMTRCNVQFPFMFMNVYRRFHEAKCSRQPQRAPLPMALRASLGRVEKSVWSIITDVSSGMNC